MSRTSTEHRLLSNRYRIEEFLGQGGMARVYRGTDLVLDRTVAVKILAQHMVRDPQAVRRFRREAQAAAGLSHPGIVAVYDTGSDSDVYFIVMEYVTGRTLADILDEAGALPPDRAIDISSAVASALAHAHGKGIVHRDVKPGNIMIRSSGEVKVMDFGIARAVTSGTFTNTASVLGTATYFAPEQARGEPVDARTDLYALGVVLYEMLAGRPPFTGDSPVAVAYQHVREEPVPPSRLSPGVGPFLDTIVLRAMAKDRAARYQTAEEVVRDLQRVRESGASAAPPPFPPAGSNQPVPLRETAVLPPVTSPEGPPPTHRPRRKARWAPWLMGLAALVAAAVASALVLTGSPHGPSGGVGRSPSSPTASTTPSTTPSPTVASQGTLSVQVALNRLTLILEQGVSDGDLSRRDANRIAHGVDDALKKYRDGDLEKALDKLDDIQGEVTKLEDKGNIAPSLAGQLHRGISDLAAAMEANPPSGREGDE